MIVLGIVALCALVFTAISITRIIVAARERRPPQPVCGCTHHRAYHDRKTGLCSHYQPGVINLETQANITCKCRGYSGPEPLPEYFAPEIARET